MWPWKQKKQPLPSTSEEELATARKSYESLVNRQLKAGVPRQVIWNQLMAMKPRGLANLTARAEAESAVARVMVDRNLKGKELEKRGKIDQAIPLYEANLVDRFGGTHPYERLRIIYTKRQDYRNAIRVCQAYIDLANQREVNARLKPKFAAHIKKLNAQAQKA